MEKGIYVIDLCAWDNCIVDQESDGCSFIDMISDTVRNFSENSNINYNLTPGYAFTSYGNELGSGTNVHDFERCRVLISCFVTDENGNDYWKYNVDGSGYGIALCEYATDVKRCILPNTINGEVVKAVMLSGGSSQLVIPDNVKILSCWWNTLEQIVVPEGVEQLSWGNGMDSGKLKAIYVPKMAKCIDLRGTDIKIFGYAGSIAEKYAADENHKFYDLTGKEKIENIKIDGIKISADEPEKGTLPISGLTTVGDFIITDISYQVEKNASAQSKCEIIISISAKEGYAITPNTLADVNGEAANIENIDAANAVIKYMVDSVNAVLKGDITGDGKVDAKDRMYLARALAGWDGYAVPGVELADFNGDGEVNAKDRMYLARKLAGWDGYE